MTGRETDSFRWLPPSLKGYYANMAVPPYDGIPWTPLAKPLREAKLALVTTAGINVTFRPATAPAPAWAQESRSRLPR